MHKFYCDMCKALGECVSDWRYSPAQIPAMEFCAKCTDKIEKFIGWKK